MKLNNLTYDQWSMIYVIIINTNLDDSEEKEKAVNVLMDKFPEYYKKYLLDMDETAKKEIIVKNDEYDRKVKEFGLPPTFMEEIQDDMIKRHEDGDYRIPTYYIPQADLDRHSEWNNYKYSTGAYQNNNGSFIVMPIDEVSE